MHQPPGSKSSRQWFSQVDGLRVRKLDPCLFTLRDPSSPNTRNYGVHVDDTALGGDPQSPVFQEALRKLRNRFPYRKWRINEGEFCGTWYKQDSNKAIHMSMQSFAEKIRSIKVPRGSNPEDLLNPGQIKVLRAVNGSLNWLSSQSRPDLRVQTSLSQRSFPRPTIRYYHAIRHARQESQMGITFESIAPEDLTLVCHSDSAFANVGSHTQAGYVIAFTHKRLQDGIETEWTPAFWKSYKMSRAVSSTLAPGNVHSYRNGGMALAAFVRHVRWNTGRL